MSSSGLLLVVMMTEVQLASFGRIAASWSAATSMRRVSYGARRTAGPGALPVEPAVRQLKRRAASMGVAVVLRGKGCGRSLVSGGNARAGSGLERASMGARRVQMAVRA